MTYRLLLFCYQLISYLLLPFALCRLYFKGRQNPAYRERIGERLAYRLPPRPIDSGEKPLIWIHCVSVGEFLATQALIIALLKQQQPLLLTTTTPTASALLRQKIPTSLQAHLCHCYLPFDLPIFTQRFIRHFRPTLALFVETEIWPNYLRALKAAQIPALLINARLSEKSARAYARIAALSRPVFALFSGIACQDVASARRFIHLMPPFLAGNVTTLGNLKFDIARPDHIETQVATIQKQLGSFVLAASTHEGEEALLLKQYARLQTPRPRLVIAPRHPERSDAIAAYCQQAGFSVTRASENPTNLAPDTIFLLDKLGVLLAFYAAADYAIIGGSFVPRGGHNPLEGALFKTPLQIGRYYFNFASLVQNMQKAGAIEVIDETDLFTKRPHAVLGERAYAFLQQNQGALQRYLQWIKRY